MRRKDREVTDHAKIMNIMNKCKVINLAMCDGDTPYIVPLNFGYRYHEDTGFALYFHCANSGKKLDILRKNPKICFEMDCGHALVQGNIACEYSFDFESIIGIGTAVFAESQQEKEEGLNAIMVQQTGKTGFAYAQRHLAAVTICRIDVTEITGKIHCSVAAHGIK